MDERNKLSCYIVEDLLPLYADGLLSEATRGDVDAHLEGCEGCREKLAAMSRDVGGEPERADRRGVNFLKKLSRRTVRIAAVSVLCALLLFGAAVWGSFVGIGVKKEDIRITGYAMEEAEGKTLISVTVSIDGPGALGQRHYEVYGSPDKLTSERELRRVLPFGYMLDPGTNYKEFEAGFGFDEGSGPGSFVLIFHCADGDIIITSEEIMEKADTVPGELLPHASNGNGNTVY